MNLFLGSLVSFLIFLSETLSQVYQPYKDTDPDYGASVYHLKFLVQEELNLLPSISIAYLEETGDNVFEDYLNDFSEANLKASLLDETGISPNQFLHLLRLNYINTQEFADDVVKHPLKSFRTIWRYVKFIPQILGLTRMKLPKQSDVEASMLNILRLRKIFRLSTEDLLKGQLEDLSTGSGLTPQQLIEISDYATTLKMYTLAIDTYDDIIRLCSNDGNHKGCKDISMDEIKKKLENVIQEHDQLVVTSEFDRGDFNIIPPDSSPFIFSQPLGNTTSEYFQERRQVDFDPLFDTPSVMDHVETSSSEDKRGVYYAISPLTYENLCRGDLSQFSNSSSLKCFYYHGAHPSYLLAPWKVEVHNENPDLVQIYDVLNDGDIKMLQDEVQNELRQSRIATADGDDLGQTTRFRTSANAWIEDGDHKKFQFLNQRVSRITGLNVTGYFSSEIVQIAAYNAGGHYTPHSDAIFEDLILQNPNFPKTELERGDRIMTFMVYLSNVEKGGCTGFSVLKTRVCPLKGSAVLWHNLNSDGSINYKMIHGGCPVLYGTKWIANKWIRSNDQMFNKKCKPDKAAWKIL